MLLKDPLSKLECPKDGKEREMARGKGSSGSKAETKQKEDTTPIPENKAQEEKKAETMALKYEVRIQSIRTEGNIKATASVNINDAFVIRNVKVMQGTNGLFASMPSYKAGNGEYKDICFPITKESRKQFSDAVLGAYEQAIQQSQNQSQNQGRNYQSQENQLQEPAAPAEGMQMAGM